VNGFKKCCIYSAMDGTDDMLWNDSKEAWTVKMETVTLIRKGR